MTGERALMGASVGWAAGGITLILLTFALSEVNWWTIFGILSAYMAIGAFLGVQLTRAEQARDVEQSPPQAWLEAKKERDDGWRS